MTISLDRHRSSPIEIPILLYHQLAQTVSAESPYSISVHQFERQLDLLQRRGFKTISFCQLANALRAGAPLLRKSVLITFDDGYQSFQDYAVPALKMRGMTATVFVVAGELGGFNRWDMVKGVSPCATMSEEAVKDVLVAGCEIGSHGWAHRDLLTCSAKELEEELTRSRRVLSSKFGVGITTFSYPYGRHSEPLYEMLAEAGYQLAVTACPETRVNGNPFTIRRILVREQDTDLKFVLKLSPFYLRWRSLRSRWRHP